jgi:hypothetical protein
MSKTITCIGGDRAGCADVLLAAQRDHRIDLGRASRRGIAGEERDGSEDGNDDEVCGRIGAAYAEVPV